jgi:uncharacterized protein (DUF2141 family)
MNKVTLFCLVLFLMPLNDVFPQYKLEIKITDLRTNNGVILLQLFDKNKNVINKAKGIIKNKTCDISFENLKSGIYAIRYFHDENSNDKLETGWMGIPTEGYGFSNNPPIIFGPPSFDKWLFEIKNNMKILLKPKY